MAKRGRIIVDIAGDLESWMLRQVEDGGFGTPAEYIRHLLQMARVASSAEEIDARLIESEKSGARSMTSKDWDAIVSRGNARVAEIRRQRTGRCKTA